MTPVRSLWLLCLVMCFAGLPLWAEQTLSTRLDASRPENPSAIPDGTTFLIRLEDKLDTAKLQQGKHFKAKLSEALDIIKNVAKEKLFEDEQVVRDMVIVALQRRGYSDSNIQAILGGNFRRLLAGTWKDAAQNKTGG